MQKFFEAVNVCAFARCGSAAVARTASTSAHPQSTMRAMRPRQANFRSNVVMTPADPPANWLPRRCPDENKIATTAAKAAQWP
jgi:hypothetical protein